MVTKYVKGDIGDSVYVEYRVESECGSNTVIGALSSVGWLNASAGNGRITIVSSEENNGKERTGYVTPTINNEPCDDKRIKVVQKTKDTPPPPGPTDCQQFIVNGDEYYLDSNSFEACDSAFLNVTQDQAIPEGKPDWVTYEWVHWDDTDDRDKMCTDYERYPCVAESLMRHAGLLACQPPDKSCKPQVCNDDPDHASISDMPQLVQDAIECKPGSYGHALGTIIYRIAANTGDEPRECTITWWINSKECQSTTMFVHQDGTGTTSTCTYKITINGLPEGETATVKWGSVNKEYGNGEHEYTTSQSRLTAEISKDGYIFNPSTMEFKCNDSSATAFTTTATEGTCTCDKFTSIGGIAKLPCSGGSRVVANYTAECTTNIMLEHKNGEDILDLEKPYTFVNGFLTAYLTPNNTTQERAGAYSVKLDGEVCKTFGVSQKGIEIPPSWSVNIRLANNSSDYICISDVIFYIDGYSPQNTTIAGCVNAGGEEYIDSFDFENVSQAPEGSRIRSITAIISSTSGGAGVTKNLSINNDILTNGTTYLLTYNG